MENDARHVVGMTFHSVHLPVLVSWQPPQLYRFVICCGCNYSHWRVKCDPVDSTLMSFKDMLDFNIGRRKSITRLIASFLETLFLEFCKVPHSNSLIKGGRSNKRVIRMECCRHNIMAMTGQDCDYPSALPIPKPNCLVVWATKNPRQLFVELYCSHVV